MKRGFDGAIDRATRDETLLQLTVIALISSAECLVELRVSKTVTETLIV